jgi:hypothetical protein
LTLNGVTAGTIAANNTSGTNAIETLNIVSTGANTATLSTNAASTLVTLNATGETALTLTNSAATNAVFNASASTGAVTVTGFGAVNQSVTGGSGGDLFNFGANLTTADTVNGGTGTDTIAAEIAQLAAFTATAANISNFETIYITNGAAGTVNAANFTGVVNLRLAGAGGGTVQTINGLASGANVRFDGGAATAVADTVINITGATTPGTNDTITLDLRGAGVALGATIAGVETVNVNLSNATGTTTLLLNDPQLTSLSLVNTGVGAFTYNAQTTPSTLINTVNFSGSTGTGGTRFTAATNAISGINFTGATGNDIFSATANIDVASGGAGNDTLVGLAASDTLTGGAGVDTFALTTAASSVTAANVDRITDFVAGTDKIGLTATNAAGALLDGVTLNVANAAVTAMAAALTSNTSVASITDVYNQLAVVLDAAAFAASNANGQVTVARVVTFTTGAAAGTYAVVNDAAAGFQAANDIVVNVTGITGTLSNTDFSFSANFLA